ncbi:hypothetical protein DRO51_02875 [Candidatus Bathyarchaeota archaeon]|nr:MAG: hypothetical protein DRO51_02875 [Candidatus Bathyarchaeota archaeon]
MNIKKVKLHISNALRELEDALDSYVKGNPKRMRFKIWKASSEVEYALFIFEVLGEFSNNTQSLPKKSEKKRDIAEYIVKPQEFLQKALTFLREEKIDEAYKNILAGRELLMEFQEKVERKPHTKV